MFFPEAPNGWSTLGSPHAQDWYEVDFGHTVQLARAQLSFFGDQNRFAAPDAFRVQVWRDGGWRDIATLSHPAANGVTPVAWAPIASDRLRVVFTPRLGRALRLVELKVFQGADSIEQSIASSRAWRPPAKQ
jgi:hypothetical protein